MVLSRVAVRSEYTASTLLRPDVTSIMSELGLVNRFVKTTEKKTVRVWSYEWIRRWLTRFIDILHREHCRPMVQRPLQLQSELVVTADEADAM